MTAATAFEKFGGAVKEAVTKTGLAMSGLSPYMWKEVATPTCEEPITFNYTAETKPVMTWDEFVAANERTGRLRVEDMPPLVTKRPLLDEFKDAARAVIREAGAYHVCSPHLRTVDVGGISTPHLGMAYIHEGKGDCIVGRILVKMGHSPEAIARFEGHGADFVIRTLYGGDRQCSEVAGLANHLQVINDSRHPWGEGLVLL